MTPDVLVVGAGPAGSALAGLLAARGVRVLLLEAARHPRPKPCGECVNPGAVAALRRLGLWGAVEPLAPASLTGWQLHAGSRRWTVDFPRELRAAAVDRERLDQVLIGWAAAQGARVEEGVRVTDLLREGDRITGVVARSGRRRQQISAGIVVGADGLRSVVVRRLGLLAPPSRPPKVAFTAHWAGVEGLSGRGELHFRGETVCGVAPLGGGRANVVLVVPAGAARAGSRGQRDLLPRWPGLRERFAGARPEGRERATGPFDQPVRGVWAPGAILVGDAAGYFDPLTGQGIYRALRSAELAVPAILGALAHGGEAPLAGYQQRLTAEMGPALLVQRLVDSLVRRPACLRAGLGLLGLCPPGARWLIGLIGDCQGVREFAYLE